MTYQTVSSRLDLRIKVTALLLGVLDGVVDQTLVSRLVCSLENERGVSGRILGLVSVDCWIDLV